MRPPRPARILAAATPRRRGSPFAPTARQLHWERARVQLRREVLRLLFREAAGDLADPPVMADCTVGDEITTRSTTIAIRSSVPARRRPPWASANRSAPSLSNEGHGPVRRAELTLLITADALSKSSPASRWDRGRTSPPAPARSVPIHDLLVPVPRASRAIPPSGATRDGPWVGRRDDLEHGSLQARRLPITRSSRS